MQNKETENDKQKPSTDVILMLNHSKKLDSVFLKHFEPKLGTWPFPNSVVFDIVIQATISLG